MGQPIKLPRMQIKGAARFNAAMETIVQRIEYLYNASGDVTHGATGPVYRTPIPIRQRWAVVTTEVPVGDGRLAYSIAGRVTFLNDTGSTPLVPDAAFTGVPVKNLHDKKFIVDAVVKIDLMDGSWWVNDVGKCTDAV